MEALQATFNSTYPDPASQGIVVSIEYPITKQSYPSIWVTYEDTNTLEIASINHREYVLDSDNFTHEVTRWNFAGTVNLTVVALSSLERDNLYDQVVRVFAFSQVEEANTDFRNIIENNDFVALNVNWDQLRPFGDGAAPGTPWGTEEEVIYERSLAFDVEGEFVSSVDSNTMVLLTSVLVQGANHDQDPLPIEFPDVPISGPHQAWSPHAWH